MRKQWCALKCKGEAIAYAGTILAMEFLIKITANLHRADVVKYFDDAIKTDSALSLLISLNKVD